MAADPYVKALGLKSVRFVKLDVEGHEPDVLGGLTRMFETTPPDVIVFEHAASGGEFWTHPVGRFFNERNYEICAIPLSSKQTPRLQRMVAPTVVPSHDYVAIANVADRPQLEAALGVH